MKKLATIICVLMMILSGCVNKGNNLEKEKLVAMNATTYFQQRKDNDFYILLDSETKNRMTVDDISHDFDEFIYLYGESLEVDSESIQATRNGKYVQVNVPVRFKHGWMDFSFTINQSSSVVDFSITASDKLDENGYNEWQYVYKTEQGEANAVLTSPNGSQKVPVVILVHDKDAFDKNSTLGVNKVFRNLAYVLADSGVASIRYDRTIMDLDTKDSLELMLAELQAVVNSTAQFERLDTERVYLLGYGVGGYLLPKLAQQLNVKGLILSSAPSGHLEEVLYREQMYLIQQDKSLASGEKKNKEEETKAALEIIQTLTKPEEFPYDIFGYSPEFWLSLKEYQAIEEVKTLNSKILITQGSNDYQVSTGEYNAWVNGLKQQKNITFKYYKNMDHLFAVRKGTSSPADQFKESEISKAFAWDLISFVLDD